MTLFSAGFGVVYMTTFFFLSDGQLSGEEVTLISLDADCFEIDAIVY